MSQFDLEFVHKLIHLTPHDPEETLTVALDMHEILLIVAGLTLVYHVKPCLSEDVNDLGRKMEEIMDVQWIRDEES